MAEQSNLVVHTFSKAVGDERAEHGGQNPSAVIRAEGQQRRVDIRRRADRRNRADLGCRLQLSRTG